MSCRHADVASLRMLRKARDRIDRDYREEIGIAALAREAGYSREHFIRAFRAAYGETPGRYRTRRRVERARRVQHIRVLDYVQVAAARDDPDVRPAGMARLAMLVARLRGGLSGTRPSSQRTPAARRRRRRVSG